MPLKEEDMKASFSKKIKVKYISSSYFIILGVINLLHTIFFLSEFYVRDFMILFLLSLPLLINKKLFFLAFGLLAAFTSIIILFLHLFTNTPSQNVISIIMYITGIGIYLVGIFSGLGMIYLGTFSNEKNSFKLI